MDGEPRSFHSTVIVASTADDDAQLSSSLSLSLSLSHLLRHVTFDKATQWKAERNDCDKATGLVATFCLPSFVFLLLLSVLLPLLLHTSRDNNTHSLIHRFSHSRDSLTSIQSCAFYIIMTKSSTSSALPLTPAPSPVPSPLSSPHCLLSHFLCLRCWPLLQLQLLLLPPLLLFTRLP